MSETPIQDVSDTALWVATYRARETGRKDALFRDPLAKILVGERGEDIARRMQASRYTEWSVVLRTVIIDDFLTKLIAGGVDTVLNCGAGLDTRPYRLALPPGLNWIEVDYPHMMRLKEERLADQKPSCKLRRVPLDLADLTARKKLFREVAGGAGEVALLTEGVMPYLTEDQVAGFADDLRAEPQFRHWIVDYFSPEVMGYIKNMRKNQLRHAPFQFSPADWEGFFRRHGWKIKERRYLGEETARLKRRPPMPLLARVMMPFMPEERKKQIRTNLAYVLLEPG